MEALLKPYMEDDEPVPDEDEEEETSEEIDNEPVEVGDIDE